MKGVIQPGATLGIFGGGQLGRMTAIAAKTLGYRVQVMDPDPKCPAHTVVDKCLCGDFADVELAKSLALSSDVVTLDIEQVPLGSLRSAEMATLLRPSADVMQIVQDRIRQKEWLAMHGFPVGAFHAIRVQEDCSKAASWPQTDIFLKRAWGGYDGRSQVLVQSNAASDLATEWKKLGSSPCVAERAVPLRAEISVLVARSPSGEIRVFPAALNHHENQILVWSVLPASLPRGQEREAQELAVAIAEALALEGILAVEMFVTQDEGLLVNELAPRPHNSYHASERACSTSQFEQIVRAVCNLPLGDVQLLRPAAIVNLLGDIWRGSSPRFDRALAFPGVRLHLYEKQTARPRRKMGHLSAIASSPSEAVQRVLEAHHAL